MTIRITVEDVETGQREVKEITDDVVVITAGRHFVDGITAYGNGTKIYTVKVDKS